MTRKARYLRASRIYAGLEATYPDAKCALNFSNPLQLLIATILSAQSTDKMVNTVTPALFARYKTAKDFAESETGELETMIHSTGFFRNKTKSIQGACRLLAEKYKGKVPQTMEELLELPGVARKTANVVLGVAFGKAEESWWIHTSSDCRGGWTCPRKRDPRRSKKTCRSCFLENNGFEIAHLLIHHGRAICHAQRPKCAECTIENLCYSEDKTVTPRAGRASKKRTA